MADVFLSYASADIDLAQRVAVVLEDAGYSVWWDRHLVSGERFQQAIQRELSAAQAVVVLWTPASVESEWVYSEARRGNQRKALVQVRTDAVAFDDVPAPFDALHCPLVDDTSALQRAVAALVREVSPPPLVPPHAPCPTCGAARLTQEQLFCADCGAPLDPARGPHLQERKVVTVLIADLEPSQSLDIEEAQSQVTTYRAGCLTAVAVFGGMVEHAAGNTLVAVFGAPRAHEDDPERAVLTGLRMLEVVTGLNEANQADVKIRVGIATGEALVTDRQAGSDSRAVAGDSTSTARRLVSEAPADSVLVDQETYAASRSSIRYGASDAVTTSKAGPAQVWTALASRGSVGEALANRSLPMIGREDELAQLQRSFARAVRERAVQLVTVVGEPGIGKSKLVDAFFGWIDDRDDLIWWRQGKCPPYGDAVAYAAFADIVKAHTNILDSDTDDIVAAKLSETVHAVVVDTDLADQEPWLVARLAPLVGLPAPETPREELFTAWRRFVEALAGTAPLVLVFEDLHWADQSLLDFVTHLLEWAVDLPLLIVGTCRPELFDEAPAWGTGHRNSTTLTLAALDDRDAAELVASLLGARALPGDVQQALLRKAAGNPLYTREYLRVLVDEHDRVLDSTRVRELADSLPGSIQAVIAARLDMLSAESKHLLQAASTVGHTFWSGAVAALTGLGAADMADLLHDLVRRDFIRVSRQTRLAGEEQYTFAHALIAEVARNQLPRADRARLHRAVAEWFSGQGGSDGADPVIVAHHFTEAHELSRSLLAHGDGLVSLGRVAASWCARAVDQLRSTDVQSALDLAKTAVRLTPEMDLTRARRLILLGEMQGLLERDDEALESFDLAATHASDSGDEITMAYARVLRAQVLYNVDGSGGDELQQAIDALEQQPELGQEIVHAYVIQSQAAARAGQSVESIVCADRALSLCDQLPDVPARLVSEALEARGTSRIWTGDTNGVGDITRAVQLATEHQLTDNLVNLHNSLAMWHRLTGTAAECVTHGETALKTAALSGRRRLHLLVSVNLTDALVAAGRLDEANDVCERATVADAGVAFLEGWLFLRNNWAWGLTLRGELAAAEELLKVALDGAREHSLPGLSASLLQAIEWDGASGTDLRQSRFLAEYIEFFDNPEFFETMAQYSARAARLLAAVDRLDLIERALSAAPGGMLLYELNEAATRAILAHARGEYEVALDLNRRTALGWERYGSPVEQAYSLLGAAGCLRALGQAARQPLLEAEVILARIGAVPPLAQTRRLLMEDFA